MWAGLAPALAHCPTGCWPSRPPPPGGRGSLLCLHVLWCLCRGGAGWGSGAPPLPVFQLASAPDLGPCSSGPLGLPSVCLSHPSWASSRGLGGRGCRESRPVMEWWGSGGCRKDGEWGAQSPGEEEGGSGLLWTVGNWPLFPCFSSTSKPYSRAREGRGGRRGSWLGPQDTPRKLVCLSACQRVNLPLGPCLARASPLHCTGSLVPLPGPRPLPRGLARLSSSLPASCPALAPASVSASCRPLS